MKKTDWKDTAELVGIVAIVASLIFVGLQMQQERAMTQIQVLADQDDTQIEWARLINENADLWARGLDGEDLDKIESIKFESLTQAYFIKRSYFFQRAEIRDRYPAERIALRDAEVIAFFPGLEAAWKKRWSLLQVRGVNPSYDAAVHYYLEEIRQGSREKIDFEGYLLN